MFSGLTRADTHRPILLFFKLFKVFVIQDHTTNSSTSVLLITYRSFQFVTITKHCYRGHSGINSFLSSGVRVYTGQFSRSRSMKQTVCMLSILINIVKLLSNCDRINLHPSQQGMSCHFLASIPNTHKLSRLLEVCQSGECEMSFVILFLLFYFKEIKHFFICLLDI